MAIAASLGSAHGPASQDPIIQQFRDQISDNDRALVEALNARLRLVAQLKSYKDSRGYAFIDPEREEWMFRDVRRANRGPLSQEGLEGSTTRSWTSPSGRSLDRGNPWAYPERDDSRVPHLGLVVAPRAGRERRLT